MKDKIQPAEEKSLIKVGKGLMPRDHAELWRLSGIVARSGLAPKGLKSPEQIFVAIAHGLEVGLTPMAALQNIAVVNGRPSIYGDALLALALRHPDVEDIVEVPVKDANGAIAGFECTVKLRGRSQVTRSFTIEDAKRAGLWGKAGPWKEYPQRMLQMRARSWAVRDAVPGVLTGLSVYEEALDVTPEPVAVASAEDAGLIEKAQRLLDSGPRIMLDEEPAPEPQPEPAQVIEGESEAVAEEPVAEPAEEPEPQPEPPSEAPELPLDDDSAGEWIGPIMIRDVVVAKEGERNGKPWTLWRIQLDDRREYGTFSKSIANKAFEAFQDGIAVKVKVETQGKYENITDMEIAGEGDA